MQLIQLTNDAIIPQYATTGSAAIDLHADLREPETIHCYAHVLIHTGIAIHINDPTLVGMIYTRSGNGINSGVTLRNNAGVIDSDYQGEIMVCLKNDGLIPFTVEPGQRIAQMVFTRIEQVFFDVVDEFDWNTNRGSGGLGSTGK